MIRFYQRNFSSIDTIIAFFASVIFFFLNKKIEIFTLNQELNRTLIEVHAGLLGFVMAFTAIIFSLQESTKLKHFKSMSKYKDVMTIYIDAIKWIGLCTIILVLMNLFHSSIQSENIFQNTSATFALFSLFISVTKIWKCVWITREMFILSNS